MRWMFILGLAWQNIAQAGDPFPISTPPAERTAGYTVTVHELTPSLVWCPPGTFTMGSPKTEEDRSDSPALKEDQVEVTLTQGFWIGRFEVTQAEWHAVMNSRPWRDEETVEGNAIAEDDQYPATCVNWHDAMSYCENLTRQERKAGRLTAEWEYTLPTEAQWEYACRAGTTTAYCFGDEASTESPYQFGDPFPAYGPETTIGRYAWYNQNVIHTWAVSNGNSMAHAQKVGQKKPNPWGIYDMHGNVGEWCLDWCGHPLPGGKDPVMTTQSTDDCKHSRVMRGGTWRQNYLSARSAARNGLWEIVRNDYHGFRVVLVPVTK